MRIYKIKVNNKTYEVKIMSVTETEPLVVDSVKASPAKVEAKVEKKEAKPIGAPSEGEAVNSPMQGTILDVLVKVGDEVKGGDNLVILEAMKLENEIKAPKDGKVLAISVSKGDAVNAGDALITLG